MAMIRKRTTVWQAIVRRKGWPPQQRSFRTRADAVHWAREVESEMDRGEFVSRDSAQRTTLKELLETYVDEVVPQHRGEESEKLRCEALAKTKIASRIVGTLRRHDFDAYAKDRLRIRKPATVQRELQLFHAAIEWGRDQEKIHLSRNPAAKVKLPQFNNCRTRRLRPGEEHALLAAAVSSERKRSDGGRLEDSGTLTWWLRPLILVAIETAMRRGELLALTWPDINLARGIASLRISKNGNPRDVPLSPLAIETLTDLPRANAGSVFPTTGNAVKLAWKRLLRRAKDVYLNDCLAIGRQPEKFLENLKFHDLRHEATSRLAKKVPNVVELSAITGHRDLNMLQRYYHTEVDDLVKKLAHCPDIEPNSPNSAVRVA